MNARCLKNRRRSYAALIALLAAPLWASPRDFATEYALVFQQGLNDEADRRNRAAQAERSWAMIDRLPETEVAPAGVTPGEVRRNEALYRRAISEFERALESLQSYREGHAMLQAERSALRDPTWWKEQEEQSRLDRVESAMTARFHREQSYWWSRTLGSLEELDRPELRESARVHDLRKRAMRMFAVNLIALGYYAPAIVLLEEYDRFPEVWGEWPLNYYLSRAYGGEFRRARRDRAVPETDLRELRRRKNLHFLRAVELKFGRQSLEWRTSFERVHLEELGSPRSSPPS